MAEVPLRAFIARPRGIEIHPIESLLRDMGVVPDDPTMRVSAAVPVYDTILNAIRTSDFAVVVFHENSDDSWLTYELGACDALKKPVLLISTAQTMLPPQLRRYMHVPTDLAKPETLEDTLRKFVEEVRKGVKRRRLPKQSKSKASIDPVIHETLWQIRNLRRGLSGVALERVVSSLLEGRAGFVEAHSAPGDRGADFALWSEAVNSALPQPIFVEVKGGKLSRSIIAQAEHRLQEAVRKGGAVAGLLLYLDTSGQRFEERDPWASNIWRADIEDFAEELSTASLATVLRRLGGTAADG